MLDLTPPAKWYAYFSRADRYPFSGSAAGGDPAHAWWLAEMSLLAYADEDFVAAKPWSGGFELSAFGDAGSTQFFLARSEAAAIVAFRGTEVRDLRQFVADVAVILRAQPVRLESGGIVPGGMKKALDDVWLRLDTALGGVTGGKGGGDRRVWFTGHSLGGALAVLAGLRYQRAHGRIARICTFGAPPMASGDLLAGASAEVYRFVYGDDIVPRLPPILYEPVGQLQFIERDGRIRATDELPRIFGANASLTGWLETLVRDFGPQCLLDHSPVRYASALQKNLAR